jgi:hypothetical protein
MNSSGAKGLSLGRGMVGCTICRTYDLVYDDVVAVYGALGQLLDEALRLVERQELRYADANERREIRVLELRVDFLHGRLRAEGATAIGGLWKASVRVCLTLLTEALRLGAGRAPAPSPSCTDET